MGYYDQDYEHLRQNRKGNKPGWVISAFVGAIIGALVILFSIPTLVEMNILPYDQQAAGIENDVKGTDGSPESIPANQTNVVVDVTTEITTAVDKVSEAVVGIVNLQESNFWATESSQEAGTGSGVVYKKAGDKAYVVTNHHVIEGASDIEVSLSDGTRVKAKFLGSDVWTDLAVLEIDGDHVEKVAEFGDSDHMKLGEPVIAIGNPLGLQFSGSVTQGIISGLNRSIPIDINQDGVPDWHADVMQTDAAINPGNSGGALVNIKGEVIGINSMKIAQSAVEGIGLSIPISIAKPIIEDLEMYNEVRRPVLGVGNLKALSEISGYHRQETLHLPEEVKDGVAILEVVPNTPASKAGLKDLDVIVEFDGKKIDSVIALRKHLYNEKVIGDSMEVTFYRNGKKQTVTVKLSDQSL
ncbi:S1C family serine protease [Litchfieldia alkalitelluris]|uniref:S1C family serine protease n=1 Tax=Litchfieldia alkalitelluris TaxID=304268 RepID=UPI000997994E|nr:trypsin-like peptidase domain-containing protein [Litchfieldia alkalitelluris]